MEGDCLVREERLRLAISVMVTSPTYSDKHPLLQFIPY